MLRKVMPLTLFLVLAPLAAFAGEGAAQAKIDSGDTAWVLVSTAFVLLMTAPGLALFYGGMVRKKNVLSVLMQSFVILSVVSLQWVLWGYSVAFSPDAFGGLFGGLGWAGLNGVGVEPNPDYAATVPHQAFMIFQMMFAVITPALITGAFAERMKFPAFLVFTLLWTTVVYDPLAHWVWGVGGWLRDLGALDFAGGTVVHISSGASALAAALVLGKRKGYMSEIMAPHNLPMTVMGAGLLWFGWFGFNAGSSLGANGLAASAFVVTNTAAAAAALAWMIAEWAHRGKPTMLGLASGAVAGLVAITPAAGFVSVASSILLGGAAGVICYLAVSFLKPLFRYDDSLDAFGIHGVGGVWGAVATGLFASVAVNSGGADGLFHGNAALLGKQLIAIGASAGYSFVATFVILKALSATIGVRASAEEEIQGLDLTEHSENAYTA